MKFTIGREALIRPLQMIGGIVERRQTLPILSNVMLKVTDDKLKLTATDLEVEMLTHAEVDAADPGQTTLPARKFLDICRALSDDAEIDVALDGERATIRSGRSRFVLSTLPAEEFPNIEAASDMSSFRLPQGALKTAIDRTAFAMAQQDVRFYLNGLLMELEGNLMRLVATDGHRLALCETPIEEKINNNQSLIIPRKAVLELGRLLGEDENEAEIRVGNNFIQITTPQMSFTSKLIDGRFPEYQNVVPTGCDKTAVSERGTLRQALGRVSILSNEKYRGVRLQFSNGNLQIFAHNPDQEEAEEEIAVDYSGNELEIGFNVNYLLDALGAGSSEQVKIALTDANSCCLIQGVGEKNCRYIVMPMRL